MKIKLEQLNGALQKKLAPIYLISGDEPLQCAEASDAVRKAAEQVGYANRQILSVDARFSWSELSFCAASLSLFDDKKIIDLRIPTGKPGKDGSKALMAYCENLNPDNLLLINSGKLGADVKRASWFKALDKVAVIVEVWPPEGRDLPQWLNQRAITKGLKLDAQSVKLLAAQTEGNLLAAAQEIEKLYVLYGAATLHVEQVADVVMDNSRFDVFNLADNLLAGRSSKATRILQGLKGEGIAEPIILWAIAREARSLLALLEEIASGKSHEQVLQKPYIWSKRKPLLKSALSRLKIQHLQQVLLLSARTDRQIKGELPGDAWDSLLHICLLFCGQQLVPSSLPQTQLFRVS